MKVGVHLPQWGADASRRGILDVACTAEAAGLDSVWVADHVALPTRSASVYPYRSGGAPFRPEDGFLEALTVLSVVAGATERVLLCTSVLVLPMREPLLVAKTLASLDVLSGGRTLFAVGIGWWEEEFTALGAGFAGRGRRFDEALQILRSAWSLGTFSFRGEYYRFDEVACLPQPVQPAGPPLLIGGSGPKAWRRAGQLGDGWHGVGADLDRLESGMEKAKVASRLCGRNPDAMMFSTSCSVPRDDGRAVERLSRLARVGLHHVVLNFQETYSAADTCAAIEWFATSVRPRVVRSATAS